LLRSGFLVVFIIMEFQLKNEKMLQKVVRVGEGGEGLPQTLPIGRLGGSKSKLSGRPSPPSPQFFLKS